MGISSFLIVESIKFVNKKPEINQFFFKYIVKEGILLYNSGEHTFIKPRELSIDEVYKISHVYFNKNYYYSIEFLLGGEFYYSRNNYITGSFLSKLRCNERVI